MKMKRELKEQIEVYENMLHVEGSDYMHRMLERYRKRLERTNKADYNTKVTALEIVLHD